MYLLCPLPLYLLPLLLLPQRRRWHCTSLAGWGDGYSLLAVRSLLVSCPGQFEKCSIRKSISASSAAEVNFVPRMKVCFALSLWKAASLFHTAKQLWARPGRPTEWPTGEALVLGHSWESFLGSLTSEGDCLYRSQKSGLWSVTHGFADKLLISIIVSTWQVPQNSRWKVSKLFIQKMLRFKIAINHWSLRDIKMMICLCPSQSLVASAVATFSANEMLSQPLKYASWGIFRTSFLIEVGTLVKKGLRIQRFGEF